jgi:hypothetical protein
MSSQGFVSSKEDGKSPVLFPVEGEQSGLNSWTRAQNHLPILSVRTDIAVVSSLGKYETSYTGLT